MAHLTLTNPQAGARPELPIPPMERTLLALDLGTTTGWALRSADGLITSGTVSFCPSDSEFAKAKNIRDALHLAHLLRVTENHADFAGVGDESLTFQKLFEHHGDLVFDRNSTYTLGPDNNRKVQKNRRFEPSSLKKSDTVGLERIILNLASGELWYISFDTIQINNSGNSVNFTRKVSVEHFVCISVK